LRSPRCYVFDVSKELRAGVNFRVAFPKSIGLILCALCVALLATSTPAAATQAPVPSTVALTKINLVSQNDHETHLQLIVEPRVNGFQALSNNVRDPTLALALTTRTSSAVTPRELHGFVRGIDFVQAEGVLVLHFLVDKGATVAAVASGDKTIEITVGAIDKPTERGVSGMQAAVGPLPPAYEASAGQDSYALVLLKYADVSEVVGLLSQGAAVKSNDVFVPREPGFGSGSLTGNNYQPQPATQAPGSSDEPLGQSVDASMAIDRRLNAVWLRGSSDYIARMKEMIAMIDIPVDSVILETEMVELTETGSKALGIDFANANGQIGVITYQRGQFIPPGIPAGDHLVSASFQAAIYAQISKGNGRILSKPRIAAQSGSTAKIITGDALPILTAITLSGVNGVQQQVQYVNVGVTLQIAPRVSNDGFVSSHIYCVVSSVTGFSQGYPTISQRQAETAATVRDGDSFVIGGLTQDENITTKTKVPLLGDIPLLGQAFRTDRNTRTKTELYIVVTPHIVHHVGTQTAPANVPLYAPTTTTTLPATPVQSRGN
jgi:general secretion pathway protein D